MSSWVSKPSSFDVVVGPPSTETFVSALDRL
jgi:hypothetical protein